jgi:hypothetical protein
MELQLQEGYLFLFCLLLIWPCCWLAERAITRWAEVSTAGVNVGRLRVLTRLSALFLCSVSLSRDSNGYCCWIGNKMGFGISCVACEKSFS